ncbi:MAG: nth [Cyanobacteria bacterium RYN_339]|nr:nth [Cyanobacteria bacterium RYN_339]
MPSFLPPAARKRVLAALGERYGGRGSGLDYRNPFELLVAVILSAQSTDKMVNVVTRPLFDALPGPAEIGALTPEALVPWIAKIGLTNTKAKHIVATCRLLLEHHGGEVPCDYEALVALPGVGRKTANVVLSNAFAVPAIPVDTHVYRVSNRLGLADHGTVDGTEQQLMKNLPRELWSEAHHWLIWHGREICKAPSPKCDACFLTEACHYYNRRGKWASAEAVAGEHPVGKAKAKGRA